MEAFTTKLNDVVESITPTSPPMVTFRVSSDIPLHGRGFIITNEGNLTLIEKRDDGQFLHTYTVVTEMRRADEGLLIKWNQRGGDPMTLEITEEEGRREVWVGEDVMIGEFFKSSDIDKVSGVVRLVSTLDCPLLLLLPSSNSPLLCTLVCTLVLRITFRGT